MQLQLIRNATLRLEYNNKTILIDPYLAPKHSLPSYTGRSLNPLVDLPLSAVDVLANVELVIVSHLHSDHFDKTAQSLLNKNLPLLCAPVDEAKIHQMGFTMVTPVDDKVTWEAITIHRVTGRHGTSPAVLSDMGEVSGFVIAAKGEPTVYWAGDTVWYDDIANVIKQFQPDVIIVHASGAIWGNNEFIVMDADQVVEVCRAAPNSTVIATHMEALDHGTISREILQRVADNASISRKQLLIPQDGEILRI